MFRPLRPSRLVPAVALAALLAGVASAQEPALEPPRVLFESAGGERIVQDFTQVLDLAGPDGASQKEGLLNLLEGFLVGVDPKAPVRVEPLTGTSPTRYRLIVPVDDRRKWQQDNLNFASGIPSRELANQKDTFQLGFVRNAAFDGFMRYYPAEDGLEYAVIVEQQEDLPDEVKNVGALLTADQDGALLLRNTAGGDEAVARRWDRVAEAEKELLSALQPMPEESPEEFDLRKTGVAVQVNELGRFYAESQVVFASGNVPDGAIGAVGTVVYQPLPGTESAAAMDRVGAEPSRFAGVPFNEDANFSGHMQVPLTPRQQANFKNLMEKMRALLIAKVNEANLPDAQRTARLEAFNRMFDLANGVVDSGIVDGIVEAVSVDGKRRFVGAVGLPKGAELKPALEAFVGAREGRQAEWGVAEVAGATLHKFVLDETFADYVDDVIGTNEIWVAVAPDAFWYAAGPGAREELESQLNAAAAGGEASGQIIRLSSDPSSAVDLIGRVETPKGDANIEEYRRIAREALANCGGRITATLRKDDDGAVRGRALAPRCLLTLIGRIIAEISERENLAG
ncbi:hypothetical protein [Alienimonas californiensis]|uniref:Uncharacterized protein n=1 Tax=Alienimonas californiensis TaxID=2527989 RepID=A0A517PDN3_9PLAN|nr:hypothetical protein [Alienimonas californiensis]QDT17498.1 hypothetical protein CA12_36240 [Alienimonas californiensis]